MVDVKGVYESMMKQSSSAGSHTGGRRRDYGSYIPCEGASVGLSLLLM